MTVNELIRKSMLLIGAISTGETPSADESADGLSSLNEILETWSTEGLQIFTTVREAFSFIANQAAYTMGSGGGWNTTRPMFIDEVRVNDTSANVESNCDIINVKQWADIVQKSTASTIPRMVYIEQSAAYQTLNFYPKPSGTNQAIIYSRKPLTAFTSINDVISLPQGYQRALRYALALELSVEYGKTPSELVFATAKELKGNLKRVNKKPRYLRQDLAPRKPFNINTFGD